MKSWWSVRRRLRRARPCLMQISLNLFVLGVNASDTCPPRCSGSCLLQSQCQISGKNINDNLHKYKDVAQSVPPQKLHFLAHGMRIASAFFCNSLPSSPLDPKWSKVVCLRNDDFLQNITSRCILPDRLLHFSHIVQFGCTSLCAHLPYLSISPVQVQNH